MDAEQIIKSKLDGKFFTINPERGVTVEHEVSKDHQPAYKPLGMMDEELKPGVRREWSPEDDELIMKMFDNGYSFKSMAQALKVSQDTVSARHKDICRELGRDPKRRNITRHHSDETKQTVIDMRAAGKPIRDVMEATGLTANQVCGIWNHYRYGGKDQAA